MGKLRVHFLGIGGSGASAAAAIAQAQGYEVTGCDLNPHNEFTTIFKPDQLLTGHSPKHLSVHLRGANTNIDILAVTPAIFSLDPQNPELLAAKAKGIKILSWQRFMGEHLEKDKFIIAVCGTHGKSTTTAMIAQLLEDAGMDPTVLLGAIIPKWKKNYRLPGQTYHDRRYFVLEADEFNDNFLATHPDITVLTNIEMDHPEYFQNLGHYQESFKKFLGQTKEKVIHPQKELINFPLKVPGQYNILNASEAYQVGMALGIDPQMIKKSLMNFTGIGRRFEYLGKFQKAEVYSDFGHHPTEIKVTLETAREQFPNSKITMIFQPHMFSRTKALLSDFVKVFQNLPVDKTYLLDIYPSRELDTGLISSQALAEAVGKDNVVYIKTEELLEKLKTEAGEGSVIFFVGAGDIDQLARKVAQR